MTKPTLTVIAAAAFVLAAGCYYGSDADRYGVGAECVDENDCFEEDQQCLLQFRGGYCGFQNCASDLDCPDASACIAHSDGVNYCFRTCVDKIDCNRHRHPDHESNCSSNVTFVDGARGRKACVPPSSG